MTAPNPAPRPDDGGPAFPYDTNDRFATGMTLRDYFAAAAMQGLLSILSNPHADGTADSAIGAKQAYEWADAMLAARRKPVTP